MKGWKIIPKQWAPISLLQADCVSSSGKGARVLSQYLLKSEVLIGHLHAAATEYYHLFATSNKVLQSFQRNRVKSLVLTTNTLTVVIKLCLLPLSLINILGNIWQIETLNDLLYLAEYASKH